MNASTPAHYAALAKANTTWTEEMDATASRMYLGGETASAIGKVLGKTRNACIGRLARLGVQRGYLEQNQFRRKGSRQEPRAGAIAVKAAKIRAKAPKPPQRAPEPPHTPPTDGPWTGGCKWPTNSWPRGEGWRAEWCGERREVGKAYCGAHCARAFAPRPQPKSERVFV